MNGNQIHTIINVEVVQKLSSRLTREQLNPSLKEYVEKYGIKEYHGEANEIDLLCSNVDSITFHDDTNMGGNISVCSGPVEHQYHIFTIEDSGPELQELDDKEDQVPAATHWQLPSLEFHGLWETLIYDTNVKVELLNFVQTTMLFSDRGVNSNIISWNRVVLLHGPPGTGKTSLCKALAQKMAIRLSHRYLNSQLVEINSHSLFSKWFSESGKLVMKMFARIQELVEDPDCLVIVLIDEVESLARARQSSGSGNEPSDSVRVVNALLTQIDQIKRFPNVLILSTSNISETIDLAFVDRADIKQYIGLPTPRAIYAIYYSCLLELIRTEILKTIGSLKTIQDLEEVCFDGITDSHTMKLWSLSKLSQGLSGRTLRKIPFLTCSVFIHSIDTPNNTLSSFLNAMERTIQKQFDDRSVMPQQ
ncbi:pachytene checkpoint protein 2 homolog [Daphnia pulex]|uniref:pachytene checkpoint protein 2 homolog n=1 Tax=Daphnia pulex TaxID=6669 RepID=UPI001EDDD4E6|nr:pachytene checkpoint protein 2 homolog [Daphnia pulex]